MERVREGEIVSVSQTEEILRLVLQSRCVDTSGIAVGVMDELLVKIGAGFLYRLDEC